jgi:hypothetical protein
MPFESKEGNRDAFMGLDASRQLLQLPLSTTTIIALKLTMIKDFKDPQDGAEVPLLQAT